MSKFQQEFENNSSKIMKTHKWLKNTSKIQKIETKDACENYMPHGVVRFATKAPLHPRC